MLRLFEAVYVYIYLSIENALCYAVHYGGEFQSKHPKIFETLVWSTVLFFLLLADPGTVDRNSLLSILSIVNVSPPLCIALCLD